MNMNGEHLMPQNTTVHNYQQRTVPNVVASLLTAIAEIVRRRGSSCLFGITKTKINVVKYG